MAGTTVPDAVSDASSGPLSTRAVRTRSRRTDGRSRSAPQTNAVISTTITEVTGSQRLTWARRRTEVSIGRSTAGKRATAVPEDRRILREVASPAVHVADEAVFGSGQFLRLR